MRSTEKIIEAIQNNQEQAFMQLYEKFKPLVITWLKQSKEFYRSNREDYESMAKIILFESAKVYEKNRGVPFQSFYKIRLYHWYSNHKRKKEFLSVSLSENNCSYEDEFLSQLEEGEKRMVMQLAIGKLDERERHIIIRHLEGFNDTQIADEINLCKKTVQNIKYKAIGKMKDFISCNFEQKI